MSTQHEANEELQNLDEQGHVINPSENEKKEKGPIKLSRCVRVVLFFFMISTELVMNNSGGLLSSASTQIKSKLNMVDKEFGLFGTSQGIGRVVGNLLYIYLNDKLSSQFILYFSLIAKGVLAIIFKVSSSKDILIILRGFVAIFRMPPSIYCGVWIDQFGIEKYKTVMMSTIPVVQTGGKTVGFLIHFLVGEENWQTGFLIQGLALVFIGLVIFFSPSIYFNKDIKARKENESETIFEYLKKDKNKEKKNHLSKFFSEVSELLSNPIWVISMIGRALLFGIVTTLNYWVSDYMKTVLDMDKTKVFFTYTLISVIGPLGGIVCNSFVNPLIGGYDKKHAALAVILLHLAEVSCGLAMSILRTKMTFFVLTLFYFLFDASVIGIINGIIITSSRPELKATGFSIANLVTHALCSGPGPFLYGYINDKFKVYPDPELNKGRIVYKGAGMLALMIICAGVVPIFVTMAIIRYRKFNEKEKKEELKEEKEESKEKKEQLINK